MTHPRKVCFLALLTLALLTAGCRNSPQEQPVDAAATNGNLAPVSDTAPVNDSVAQQQPAPVDSAPAPRVQSAAPRNSVAQAPRQYPQQQQPQQYAAPAQPYQRPQYQQPANQQPASPQYQDQPYQDQEYSDQDYPDSDQAAEYAPEPPPPLPEYQQPSCPNPNYIWTPGYWAYGGGGGYYWVPGVWAYAPYTGALWTPGYWNYNQGRYGFHRGFWARFIGYYGGVNYGNGYVGRGYYGGYWDHDQFRYNRQVTNVNVTTIHNTYITNVTNITTYNRVSYNGGRGGVNLQPSPQELAVLKERRLPPLAVQQQNLVAASRIVPNSPRSIKAGHKP